MISVSLEEFKKYFCLYCFEKMLCSSMKKKVLEDLNKYGKDLLDVNKCAQVYQELLEKKALLENQIDPSNHSGDLGKTLLEASSILQSSSSQIENSQIVCESINQELTEITEVKAEFKEHVDKFNEAQTLLQYMKVVQQVEFLCAELDKEFSKKDDEKCVTLFVNLTEISRYLYDCPVEHFQQFLHDTILDWHNILKDKLASDFDEVLKHIKWPFVSTNFSMVSPLQSHIEKLQTITEYLLEIEVQNDRSQNSVPSGVLSHFEPLCLPVHLLVKPLKKRFLYHFYGARQTNRVDKPEWYFTQILTWVRDHIDFVEKWIQPVINKLGRHYINARLELIRGLVKLAVEKLNSELPSLQFDDFTFSHSIDEALGFDKELRETYEYPATEPGVLLVLTQAQVFMKWIIMEKKYATEKMDAILSPTSIEAFDLLTSDVEDLKITVCADAFITLLQTITERYESLPQPGHRLQFLELQLELLDDFRVRLLQLVNAEEGNAVDSKVPMIANTVYYIENVLVDWGAMLHFINLYYYKTNLEPDRMPSSSTLSDADDSPNGDFGMDTVFAETLSLYRHLRKDLLCVSAETVMDEIKNRSWNYRRDRWSSMKTEKEFRSLSLTPSACPMFEILAKRLHQLQKNLQSQLFTIVWHHIAVQLDSYLFEDLIMDNRFNDGGALQLKFDITRNLIPLFAQFTEKPDRYFTQVMESCNLLNLSKGSALLLRETLLALEGATGVEDTRGKTLKEVGVANFSPRAAVAVLNQRIDLTVNRLAVD